MEKINIAELLKDCPKGMELNCSIHTRPVIFNCVKMESDYPIRISSKDGFSHSLTYWGSIYNCEDAKCVIFPKGKTTWEGFQRPFKDGDIVFYNDTIAIFKEWGDETLFRTYVNTYLYCDSFNCDSFIDVKVPLFGKHVRKEIRFATEEEKQKLFEAIKDNGYKWNSETKTLEKLIVPKFKVGDVIKWKGHDAIGRIEDIKDSVYHVDFGYDDGVVYVGLRIQDDYELVPNKFDISSLIPFESRVLFRNTGEDI